jgi:AcrR family transcriptional regulator
MLSDGRLARGDRTRTAVLDKAVTLATEYGLAGLSLGQLAEGLGVSKSGLFAHWRSKEELQLATIEHAREQFGRQVVAPALKAPRGVRRLWALHEARIAYIVEVKLPGGCFFTNAQFEYDARPGPIRDRLAEVLVEWLATLERVTAEAIETGELRTDATPRQVAFEVNAIGAAMVYQSRLVPADDVAAMGRAAVLRRLRALCPDPSLLPEE